MGNIFDNNTKVIDKYGSGIDGLTEGKPAEELPGSRFTFEQLDWLQENIARLCEDRGIVLSGLDSTQIFQAIARPPNFFRTDSAAQYFNNYTGLFMGTTGNDYAYDKYLDMGVVVGDSGLILSNDPSDNILRGTAAPSQTRTPDESYSSNFNSIIFDEFNKTFIAVGQLEEIQISTDGENWTRKLTGADELKSIASNDLGTVIVVGENSKIYKTTDGGNSFSQFSLSLPSISDFIKVVWNGNYFVAMSDVSINGNVFSIYRSADGESWENILLDEDVTTQPFCDFVFFRGFYVFIQKTANVGNSYYSLSMPTSLSSLIGNEILLFQSTAEASNFIKIIQGNGNLFISGDGSDYISGAFV